MKHNSTHARMPFRLFISLAAALLFALTIRAQSFQLIKDIQPGSQPLSNLAAVELIPFGDSLLVLAESDIDGMEIWLYDGDPNHTQQLQNIGRGSYPVTAFDFTEMGGKMYFSVGRDGRRELWRTNGSVAGTVMVYAFAQSAIWHDMVRHGNQLLILVRNGGQGTAPSLWSSDGTALGTDSLIGNLYTNDVMQFVQMGGKTYFASQDQIWRTNGLPGGTIPLLTTNTVNGIGNLTAYHDRLWFLGTDLAVGRELWSCDTAASVPTLHDDYNPQGDGAVMEKPMFVCDDRLFYYCTDGGVSHGEELRNTDGNAQTAAVFDWYPGANDSYLVNIAATEHYFFGRDLTQGGSVMGNAAGLQQTPNGGEVGVDVNSYSVKGDTMIFLNGPNTSELWIAEGSLSNVHAYDASRTMYVRDVCSWGDSVAVSQVPSIPGRETITKASWVPTGTRDLAPMPDEAFSGTPTNLFAQDGKVYFTAWQQVTGSQVWVTDGTTAGTQSLGDIWPGNLGYPSGEFVAFNGKVYWTDGDPAHGLELWSSDGTPGGTQLAVDVNPGVLGSNPSRFIATDDHLFFQAHPSGSNYPVTYRTDGTAQGTQVVANISNGPGSSTWPVARLGNNVIVEATSNSQPDYLYIGITSAYSSQATTLLRLPQVPSYIKYCYMDNNLYFVYPDSNYVDQIWRTNGTVAGTYRISNYSTVQNAYPRILGVMNGKLIIAQRTDSIGREIYASDGSMAGTYLLRDIYPGPNDGFVGYSFRGDQKCYFEGLTATEGRELWVTDGTPGGTTLVTDLSPGTSNSYFSQGHVHNGHLYTKANREGSGIEMLESDGSASGTHFYEFGPGIADGTVSILEPTNQGLLVVAHDDAMGSAMYLASGGNITALPDPTGDPRSIAVVEMAMSANGPVLSMHTPAYGRELWRLDGLSLLTGTPRATEPTATTHAGLRAFPVPAQDHVQVTALEQRSPITAWQLLSLGGQSLASARIAPGGACDIDLAGLPAGLYIVRTTHRDGSTAAIKFVKE